MLAPATPRPGLSRAARKIGRDPLGFAAQTIRAFRANQGLLLAGGVAYYTLLSIVPLMILLVIILSHVIDAEELMSTLARYLGIVVPRTESQDSSAGDQWTVPEMWLSACVGRGSRKDEHPPGDRDTVHPSRA